MKRIVLVAFCMMFVVALSAQKNARKGGGTQEDIEPNCYHKYASMFEKRGANSVADGVYKDVIITVRSGINAECFFGKVKVEKGKFDEIYMKYEDGSYELLDKKLKHKKPIGIVNGMSEPRLTIFGEIVNVMFVKSLKSKSKRLMRAPDPIFDPIFD